MKVTFVVSVNRLISLYKKLPEQGKKDLEYSLGQFNASLTEEMESLYEISQETRKETIPSHIH